MAFCKDERLLNLIDGASHFVACMQLNIEIDFCKLLKELRSKGRLLRANYYTILIDRADNFSYTRPLVDWLAYNGYLVVKKIAREFTDTDGRKKSKGKRVLVASTAQIQPPVASDELRKEADNLIEIMKISDRIMRSSLGNGNDYHS